MKRLINLCFYLFITFSVFGQTNGDVVIGKIETLKSDILNEERTLWIHVPRDYDGTKEYPVVYLLDGSIHFTSVVGLVQQHSAFSGNSITPEMIVVGILNTNRTRDLTPTKVEAQLPMMPESIAKESGGGKSFMAFIEKELVPYIESNFVTAPYRVFIGHSFGGLTVMNTFVHQPELFNAFISIDPSMMIDNEKLLADMKSTSFSSNKYKGKVIFMGIARNMPEEMDTIEVMEDQNPFYEPFRAGMKTKQLLAQNAGESFRFKSKLYLDDNHTSVPMITEYDGLRFIFKDYDIDITPEEVMNPNSNLVERVKQHYERATQEFGYNVRPDEDYINHTGYMLMEMKQLEMAGQFFKMNVDYYPKSANVYDSLGDYYAAVGDEQSAIKSYQQAIKIDDYPPSKKKLRKLTE